MSQKYLSEKESLFALEKGEVIVVPTDTIPGLACDATNAGAIKKIYDIKKRSLNKPIALLFSDLDHVNQYTKLSKDEQVLAAKHWPGALTIIVKKRGKLPQILENSAGKIGIRIPDFPRTLQLIKKFGKPIAATSLNYAGDTPITDLTQIPVLITANIAGIYGKREDYFAGKGKASTVVELNRKKPGILRQGSVQVN